MNSKKSILTEPFSNLIAAQVKKLTTSSSNTFIGIGRIIDSGSTENNIEDAIYTTVYRNQVYKNLVALKKIVPSDIQPVIPRVDWTSNRMYDAYDDMVQIYDYRDYYSFGTVNANANTTLTGTANIAASNAVIGNNSTQFLTYIFAGDRINVNNEIKTVVSVTNNKHLIVSSNFTNTNTDGPIVLLQNNTIIVANSANFIGNVDVGNVIVIGEDTREVVALRNNKVIAVNTSLTYSNSNVTIRRQDNTFTLFANTFYVRNTRDQVFKCLFNNSQTNSTIEPTIDIDGQLPENAFILTSDGYKWKYMYTIPPGLKQKFFTQNWMPVANDAAVQVAAGDGRVDIINVLWGGSGHLSGGNSNSASILSITNTDGAGANLVARVANGVITSVAVLDGGNSYTSGTVTVNDLNKLGSKTLAGTINVSSTVITGNTSNSPYFVGNVFTNDILTINGETRNVVSVISDTSLTVNTAFNYAVTGGIGLITRSAAVFDISYPPKGGHGSDPAKELGARDLMISVELISDENETLPISDAVNTYHFNQISVISDPLIANGAWTANSTNYRYSTRLTMSDTGITNFTDDETVYIGSTLSGASMVANVVHWDTDNNYLYINNITGPITGSQVLKSVKSGVVSTIIEVKTSEIKPYTGDVLYIENRKNVVRDIDQIEQVKIVLTF
jgi:hypothetical protein